MKTLKWTDVYNIAIELEDSHPLEDISHISFTKLWHLVLALPDFEDDPKKCNERILEAIQQAWLNERA